MLTIYCSKIFLSCAYIAMTIAIPWCMLIINCGLVIFYRGLIFFSAESRTFLCAYHELQQGNPLSYANISLPQASRCYMLMYCSDVIFCCVLICRCCKPYVVVSLSCTTARYILSCAYISLLQAIRCCVLSYTAEDDLLLGANLSCYKPYVVMYLSKTAAR